MKFIGETRFNVGDIVWTMENNKPAEYKICRIEFYSHTIDSNIHDEYGFTPPYHYVLMPNVLIKYDYELSASKEELKEKVFS